ncbi:hypothetical protein D3C75_834160 [compost metagenome]
MIETKATTISMDRSMYTPTNSPFVPCLLRRNRATRLVRLFNSLYVNEQSLNSTATASGVCTACASIMSMTLVFGYSTWVSFHTSRIRRFSSSGTTDTRETFTSRSRAN